jgi:putative peptide zinc metalloprotease protein
MMPGPDGAPLEARPADQRDESVWDSLDHAVDPSTFRPRLVDDIESAKLTTRDGVEYVVVHSPTAGKYLKLDPREFQVMQRMDGTRTVHQLVDEFFKAYGLVAFARIPGLVNRLRESRFLTDPPVDVWLTLDRSLAPRKADELAARIARGFVQTRIPLAGADTHINRVYQRVARPMFSRPAILVGAVFALAGPALFAIELFRGRYDVYRLGGSVAAAALLYAVLTFIAVVLHELGHGCAVVHAGRRVREGGFLIYFGLPSAYVDTSDVWMVPRRARLRTSLAGPWTGLVFGGITATLTVILPRSPVGTVLFALTLVFAVAELVNFNPLLELDGYYMLIDLLEKPLLRPRSIRFVRSELWGKLRRREKLTGEERLFGWFGLASIGYSLLAVGLAFRFYAAHVIPGFRDAWRTGSLPARTAAVVLLTIFLAPLVFVVFTLVRRLAHSLWLEERRLRREVSRHRHRELRHVLARTPVAIDLPVTRIEELAAAMRLDHAAPGRIIVRQGAPADRFWLVVRGSVEANLDGVPVQRLGPGDHFGERSLLGGGTHHRTMVAHEHVLLASLGRQDFLEFLGADMERRQRLETMLRYREAITGCPVFEKFSPSEVDLLLVHMEAQTYEAGATIAARGTPVGRFGIVATGSVTMVGDDGPMAELEPGDTFGEAALRPGDDEATRHDVTLVAGAEGCAVLTMTGRDARDILGRYYRLGEDAERLSHLHLERHASVAS